MNVSVTAQPLHCILYIGYDQHAKSENAKIPCQTGTSTIVLFNQENSWPELYGCVVDLVHPCPWLGCMVSKAKSGKEETLSPMTKVNLKLGESLQLKAVGFCTVATLHRYALTDPLDDCDKYAYKASYSFLTAA